MNLAEKEQSTFDQWALVELMGHQRIAGRVTEAQIGGTNFVRVDVPQAGDAQPITRFFGPSAIYAITPMSEATARAIGKQIETAPVFIWDAKRLVDALPPPNKQVADGDDEEMPF